MKRKLTRLLARVQNVVMRVWRRLFPETTEEAQLPASKPRTIRGFDSVTDAEYEDVTVVSPPPPAIETPVLEWMSTTTEAENRTLRATELAAELESFLRSNDAPAGASGKALEAAQVAEPAPGAESVSMAARIPPEPDQLAADAEVEALQAVLESAAARSLAPAQVDAPLAEPVAEVVSLHVETEGAVVEAEVRIDAESVDDATEAAAFGNAPIESTDEPVSELASLHVETEPEAVEHDPLPHSAGVSESVDAERVAVEELAGEEPVVAQTEAESRTDAESELDGDSESAPADAGATDDIAYHAPRSHFAASESDGSDDAATLPDGEARQFDERSSKADDAGTETAASEGAALDSSAGSGDAAPDHLAADDATFGHLAADDATPGHVADDDVILNDVVANDLASDDVAADDGVEAAAAAEDDSFASEADALAASGDDEPGASAEAMAAAQVAEPHHEKTWDEAALAELTADVSEATPVEEIAAAAELDVADETATLATGIDAEAALADAMAAVADAPDVAVSGIAPSDSAVAGDLDAIDIAEAAEAMVSAEAVASRAEHAAEAARAVAQAEVEAEAAAEANPVPVAGTIRIPVPPIQIPSDYVPAAESGHAIYQLQLDGFEGPLDLLLHLIKRHHVDIFDIPVAFICEQYLKYLKMMEDLDIDVAAEFLFMASELLHIKSRLLLPKPEGETVEEDDVDPRAELVRRLLEYQKYKDAAEKFSEFDRFNRDIFGRDAEDPPPALGEAPLKEVGLFALVKAFESVLKRQKPEVRHQVMMEQVSVRARIRVLLTQIETITSEDGLRFEDLLADAHRRIDIVVTFLALLEMGKLKLLRIFQGPDGVIYLYPKFDDVTAAFARLEGIDESQYA